ncbi:MAG: hypothetical protein ACRDIB_03670, partial [Ardenticatenaceae bacterium]
MSHFTTTPAVARDAEGRALAPAEEVALVIGQSARQLQEELEEQKLARQARAERYALAGVILVLLLAGFASWWTESRGLERAYPWIIAATILLLVEVAILYISRTRANRWERHSSTAAATALRRHYWPIGIVPLSHERAIIWDPLADERDTLCVMDLPEGLGRRSEQQLHRAERLGDAFDALLLFSEGVAEIEAEPVAWPGTISESAAGTLSEELGRLWQE